MSVSLISDEFLKDLSLNPELLRKVYGLFQDLLKAHELSPKRKFVLKDGTELSSMVEAFSDDMFLLTSHSGEEQRIHVADINEIFEIETNTILELRKYLKEL